MKKTLAAIVILAACFAAAGPLFAHHGVSGYAVGKTVSITGIVTDFQFINPHAIIYMDAKDDKGNVLHWQGELTSPNHLVRAPTPWSKETLKPGDKITIVGLVAKNGSPSMRVDKVLRADGQEIQQQEDQ
ncbi:MAG: DUF6152 family protein [Candidatus Acidiferrales bacterium]|jgi:hypothetical protein